MAESECARCGKIGHWARDCTNPLGGKGAQGEGGNSLQPRSLAPARSTDGGSLLSAIPVTVARQRLVAIISVRSQTEEWTSSVTHDTPEQAFPIAHAVYRPDASHTFSGLVLQNVYALLDTGTEFAVAGRVAFEAHKSR